MTTLETAAFASLAWAAAALTWSAARAWRRPTPRATVAPAGSAWTGLIYAFGAGMDPRAKESASHHPLVYAAGLVYHLGVFAGLATLAIVLSHATLPRAMAVALGIAMFAGAMAGILLLARRARSPLLRAISAPDDYASNIFVDAWLGVGALAVFTPAVPAFLVASIVLAAYVPLGKIRHCLVFFTTRYHLGVFFGRRGSYGSFHG
jgi:hypothetical protein